MTEVIDPMQFIAGAKLKSYDEARQMVAALKAQLDEALAEIDAAHRYLDADACALTLERARSENGGMGTLACRINAALVSTSGDGDLYQLRRSLASLLIALAKAQQQRTMLAAALVDIYAAVQRLQAGTLSEQEAADAMARLTTVTREVEATLAAKGGL